MKHKMVSKTLWQDHMTGRMPFQGGFEHFHVRCIFLVVGNAPSKSAIFMISDFQSRGKCFALAIEATPTSA
jgi:hypothetical protein